MPNTINVFLFVKDGLSFEIYPIPSGTFNVNYGKMEGDTIKWIENFKTMDLQKSLEEILN